MLFTHWESFLIAFAQYGNTELALIGYTINGGTQHNCTYRKMPRPIEKQIRPGNKETEVDIPFQDLFKDLYTMLEKT